jgi:hypothetical protein
VIVTSRANPRVASQAPKVSKIRIIKGSKELIVESDSVIVTKPRIIASKDSSDMRSWVRCRIKDRNAADTTTV